MPGPPPKIRLGELLLRANVLSEVQLKAALLEQSKWGGKLGDILVRMSYLTEELLVKALAKQLSLQRADLDALAEVPEVLLRRIPREIARAHGLVPLGMSQDSRSLFVAMSDPFDVAALDAVRIAAGGLRIVPYIAGSSSIGRAIARFYGEQESIEAEESSGSFRLIDSQGRTILEEAMSEQSPHSGELAVLVDLLIEKGVFTRDEYLARIRR